MKIGIISYLPDNEELREKRKQYIDRSLTFFHNNVPEIPIVCFAQNYKEHEYDNRVSEYLKFEKPIGFSKARNTILKYLYESDDDYMLVADDDSIVYSHYDAVNMIRDINENPHKFHKLDYINSLTPAITPFKKQNYKDKSKVEKNHRFISIGVKNCNLCFIKNFRKFYNKDIYFDETKNAFNGLEDVGFITTLIENDYKVATCSTLILNAPREHSVWNKDPESRKKCIELNKQVMIEEHGKFGLTLTKKNNLDWCAFYKLHNQPSFPLYVERSIPFEFPDNLIIEGVNENTKPKYKRRRLF